jgi:hypothetical protein
MASSQLTSRRSILLQKLVVAQLVNESAFKIGQKLVKCSLKRATTQYSKARLIKCALSDTIVEISFNIMHLLMPS